MNQTLKRLIALGGLTAALSVAGAVAGPAANAEPDRPGTHVGDVAYAEWGGAGTVGEFRWSGSEWVLWTCR